MDDTINLKEKVVNNFLLPDRKISLEVFARLPPPMTPKAKKTKAKKSEEDRTALQIKAKQIVKKNDAAGWIRSRIARRAIERRRPMPASTISAIINGHDPSIKTLEKFALSYDEDPIELFRISLDDPPEPDEILASPAYRIFSLYRNLEQNGNDEVRARAAERIEETVAYLRKLESSLTK